MKALALVSDLMFSSRITAEAKAAGAQVQILRKPEQLEQADDWLQLRYVGRGSGQADDETQLA